MGVVRSLRNWNDRTDDDDDGGGDDYDDTLKWNNQEEERWWWWTKVISQLLAGWLDCLTPNDDRRQTLWENSLIGSIIDCFKGNSFRSVLKTLLLCLILHILFFFFFTQSFLDVFVWNTHAHTHSNTSLFYFSLLSLPSQGVELVKSGYNLTFFSLWGVSFCYVVVLYSLGFPI